MKRQLATSSGFGTRPRRCTALPVLLTLVGCTGVPGTPAPRTTGTNATPPAPVTTVTTSAVPAPPTRPAPASTLPATGLSPQDIEAITAHHNKVRADVGVAPLKWSTDLAGYAQQWAEQLAISGCRMKHRSPNDYGENLFQGTVGAFTAVDAAKAWETEKKDYPGGVLTEANWAPAGHYTQMVWRQTTHLGCGQAICRNTLIVACNYAPAGNVIGRRPY